MIFVSWLVFLVGAALVGRVSNETAFALWATGLFGQLLGIQQIRRGIGKDNDGPKSASSP
jgi:hypothetical protein